MLSMLWNLSAAVRGYLRFYMPTNSLLDWLRTPRGVKWAVPVALLVTAAYLFGASAAGVLAARSGIGWLNALVLLFFWDAMKFAWIAALAPLLGLRWVLARRPRALS